jgi:hypothetical protein
VSEGDCLYHVLGLPVLPHEVRAYVHVRPFDLVVYRLPNIVEEPAALGELNVVSYLGGQYAADERDFDRMVQDILRIAGPVFESSDELQSGWMTRQVENAFPPPSEFARSLFTTSTRSPYPRG